MSPEAISFFDEYVHDSRAWFKLIPGNPDSEADMHAKLEKWIAMRRKVAAFNEREQKRFVDNEKIQRVASGYSKEQGNQPGKPMLDGLTGNQRRATDEYMRTKKIPSMLTEGREPFVKNFVSAKAGYLRFRKIYAGGDSFMVSQVPPNASEDGVTTA